MRDWEMTDKNMGVAITERPERAHPTPVHSSHFRTPQLASQQRPGSLTISRPSCVNITGFRFVSASSTNWRWSTSVCMDWRLLIWLLTVCLSHHWRVDVISGLLSRLYRCHWGRNSTWHVELCKLNASQLAFYSLPVEISENVAIQRRIAMSSVMMAVIQKPYNHNLQTYAY